MAFILAHPYLFAFMVCFVVLVVCITVESVGLAGKDK